MIFRLLTMSHHMLLSGTEEFIAKNPNFLEIKEAEEKAAGFICNKDTGGLKTFHCWSRGIFFIVSAGGHIEYWQPLYRYLLYNGTKYRQTF